MKLRFALLAVALLCFAVRCFPSDEVTLNVEGTKRLFLLHVPPGHSTSPMPVVIAFHGFNETAANLEKVTGTSNFADDAGFIAVYPQGEKNEWHVFGLNDVDVIFVRAIVDYLEKNYSIDKNRIYAEGISNGAQMSYRLGCDASDIFAAYVMNAGNYSPNCKPSVKRPVLMIHGTEDRLLPYSGRGLLEGPRQMAARWAAIDDCHPSPKTFLEKGDVTAEEWHCEGGPLVQLYTVRGQGHVARTQDVKLMQVMWDFFEQHPREK